MKYFERNHLFIIREDNLSQSFLDSFENLHNNFPSSIFYIENSTGLLVGIFSLREYKKSILEKKLIINRNFLHIDLDSIDFESEREQLKNRGILNIPVTQNSKLLGEYNYHEVFNLQSVIDWNAFRFKPTKDADSILGQYLLSHLEKVNLEDVVHIGVSDHLVRNISTCLSDKFKIAAINSSLPAIKLYSMNDYYTYIRKSLLTGGEIDTRRHLSLYNCYIHCLVVYCILKLKHANIDFYYFGGPSHQHIKNLSERDKSLLSNPDSMDDIRNSLDILDELFGANHPESKAHFLCNEEALIKYRFVDSHFEAVDLRSENCSIINGKRVTCFQPDVFQNQIHIFGVCTARGICVANCDTVASYLQCLLNDGYPNEYLVSNYGVAEGVIGAALNDFLYICNTSFSEGDIVICLSEYEESIINLIQSIGGECYETSNIFEDGHCFGRWFFDTMLHISPQANQAIANYIYTKMSSSLSKPSSNCKSHLKIFNNSSVSATNLHNSIMQWVKDVRKDLPFFQNPDHGTIGSIVMNCNPFTNGHLYLIETAATKVDHLIVFVVEEDRSIFAFNDRIELVKEGTQHIKNVDVIPSGNFIISTTTFPEYFNKNALQGTKIDPTDDVLIFCEHIAPALEITARFVGEEPFDSVTESYNRTMERELDKYGIKFIEIPRKTCNEKAISASRVRNLIEEAKWEEVKLLVPTSTYAFLWNTFGK